MLKTSSCKTARPQDDLPGGKLPSTKQHAPIKPTDGSGYWISSLASFDNF
jgi:hypothetical protein